MMRTVGLWGMGGRERTSRLLASDEVEDKLSLMHEFRQSALREDS